MKKLCILFLLFGTFAQAQSLKSLFKKKKVENTHSLSKEQVQELNEMFKPSDSITAVTHRDVIVSLLNSDFKFQSCHTEKNGDGNFSKIGYLYKKDNGQTLSVSYDIRYRSNARLPMYQFRDMFSSSKDLFVLWSSKFHPEVTYEKVLGNEDSQVFKSVSPKMTFVFREYDNKSWYIKNLAY